VSISAITVVPSTDTFRYCTELERSQYSKQLRLRSCGRVYERKETWLLAY